TKPPSTRRQLSAVRPASPRGSRPAGPRPRLGPFLPARPAFPPGNGLLRGRGLPRLRLRSYCKMLATDETVAAPRALGAAPAQRAAAEKWTREAVAALFEAPFADLLFRAQSVHREHFDPNR